LITFLSQFIGLALSPALIAVVISFIGKYRFSKVFTWTAVVLSASVYFGINFFG